MSQKLSKAFVLLTKAVTALCEMHTVAKAKAYELFYGTEAFCFCCTSET